MNTIAPDHSVVRVGLNAWWRVWYRDLPHGSVLAREAMAAALTAALPEIITSGLLDDFVDERCAKYDRAVKALRDAVEGMDEMIGYVNGYFRKKWDHDGYLNRGLAALRDLEADE